MDRRKFLAALSASLASAAGRLPANKNVKWALSLGLWNHFKPVKLTDVFDVMKDTGFKGVRITGFKAFEKTYGMTPSEIQKEASKRGVQIVTISFGGPTHDASQRKQVLADAKEAMSYLKQFGANHLVVFPPGRRPPQPNWDAEFKTMCESFNAIGELAGTMGFRAGVHNHLDEMVETPEEVHKCMAMTDPKLFHFFPDTAHLHLGGSNVPEIFRRYKDRIAFMDYKDAKWTNPASDVVLDNGKVYKAGSPSAKFFSSIYDLGDGEIDFPACHRVLKEKNYKGWICVDLDAARKGPRVSYERSGDYIVKKLEPIYA